MSDWHPIFDLNEEAEIRLSEVLDSLITRMIRDDADPRLLRNEAADKIVELFYRPQFKRQDSDRFPPGTWSYAVLRRELDGETAYAVHEMYDGGRSWTLNPVAAQGETVEELRAELIRMLHATTLPVLDDGSQSPAG